MYIRTYIYTYVLVLKRIVNFTIRIVGIKTTEYLINLPPKPLIENDQKSLAKQLIIKEITERLINTNKTM